MSKPRCPSRWEAATGWKRWAERRRDAGRVDLGTGTVRMTCSTGADGDHLTPTGGLLSKTEGHACGGDSEKPEPCVPLAGVRVVQVENGMAMPQKIKHRIAIRPGNSPGGKVRPRVNLCALVFGAALFTTATRWEQPKCPRVDTQGVAPPRKTPRMTPSYQRRTCGHPLPHG